MRYKQANNIIYSAEFKNGIKGALRPGARTAYETMASNTLMGLLQLRYEHDSSTNRVRFERDTTSYEELCAFGQ